MRAVILGSAIVVEQIGDIQGWYLLNETSKRVKQNHTYSSITKNHCSKSEWSVELNAQKRSKKVEEISELEES